MYWIHTIHVFCLLLLLDNIENFQLFQNISKLKKHEVFSSLKKQSSQLKASNTINRQSHTCIIDCYFSLSFDDTFILPEGCNEIETNNACGMISTIDYIQKEIDFYFFEQSEGLTVNNITYDSSTIHIAYMDFTYDSILHIFDYTCINGNNCGWKYIQEMIPKLIILDYQSLFNSLSPLLYNSTSYPNEIQCYKNITLVNCLTATCWFFQGTDLDYHLDTIRDCAVFENSYIEIGKLQYMLGSTKYDYDTIDFTCNKDKCNGELNEDEIKTIIASKGNEYIYSFGNISQSINVSLYFLALVFILFYKLK